LTASNIKPIKGLIFVILETKLVPNDILVIALKTSFSHIKMTFGV
jgi:hypothetical protein